MRWSYFLIIIAFQTFFLFGSSKTNEIIGRLLEIDESKNEETDREEFVNHKEKLREVKKKLDEILNNCSKIKREINEVISSDQLNAFVFQLYLLEKKKHFLKYIEEKIKNSKELSELHEEVLTVQTTFLDNKYEEVFKKISHYIGPFKAASIRKETDKNLSSEVESEEESESHETSEETKIYIKYANKLKHIKQKMKEKQPELKEVKESIAGPLTSEQKEELNYLTNFAEKIRKKLKKYYKHIKEDPNLKDKNKKKLEKTAKKLFTKIIKLKGLIHKLLSLVHKSEEVSTASESESASSASSEKNSKPSKDSSSSYRDSEKKINIKKQLTKENLNL